VARLDGLGGPAGYDVVVIGAGPAGFSASLSAMEHGLRYLTLDQETFGGTVAHYPRGKLVMTAPADLPLVGQTDFRETTKEALLGFWQDVVARTGVTINHQERVEAIEPSHRGFVVHTPRDAYPTRAVVLAIGRRGSPRKLEVPGEDSSKVVYRLIDPNQYRGNKVLVVGGGDSALEAALALAGEPGTTVTLSYRGEAFSRAKEKNRQAVEAAAAAGHLDVLLSSNVEAITDSHVGLEQGGQGLEIENEAVIVAVGGILPTRFLKDIGIQVETKYGTA
jgi:thioredoxin reductase